MPTTSLSQLPLGEDGDGEFSSPVSLRLSTIHRLMDLSRGDRFLCLRQQHPAPKGWWLGRPEQVDLHPVDPANIEVFYVEG